MDDIVKHIFIFFLLAPGTVTHCSFRGAVTPLLLRVFFVHNPILPGSDHQNNEFNEGCIDTWYVWQNANLQSLQNLTKQMTAAIVGPSKQGISNRAAYHISAHQYVLSASKALQFIISAASPQAKRKAACLIDARSSVHCDTVCAGQDRSTSQNGSAVLHPGQIGCVPSNQHHRA